MTFSGPNFIDSLWIFQKSEEFTSLVRCFKGDFMSSFRPIRQWPSRVPYKSDDVLVVFGEVFQRGYVNGLIDEAIKAGMKVIYSTVGRRDNEGNLRSLTDEEIQEKNQSPMINVPLEAGFDLSPSEKGRSPVDQLQGVKMSQWKEASLDWSEVAESEIHGKDSFRERTRTYLAELEKHIPKGANVMFAHTMAGGVPRAKVILPVMNKVFKGHGDRYASSEEFWKSPLGQLCDRSFMEVTANTFHHLIDLSKPLRERLEKEGSKVSYVAFGYHGNEILIQGEYKWQSYSPYLQGFAKLELEAIAQKAWDDGISACVFNAPEILTNSSSIFLGVEVALYPLMAALQKEGGDHPKVKEVISHCEKLIDPKVKFEDLVQITDNYFGSDLIQNKWSDFEAWPQHNGPEQMEMMRNTSNKILDLHLDSKKLMTQSLSEIVFHSCGKIMLREGYQPESAVWWIGHDACAKEFLKTDPTSV
tara:strand:- start:5086 stop:6504 length:1419 start_codon:yes stop_codon:yes gene_type:complete